MFRRARIAVPGLILIWISAAPALFAAVPVPPEFQQSREEDRIRQIQMDAEISLREKIEVGKQRYEERQAFRQAVIEGMQYQAEARRNEVTGTPDPSSQPHDRDGNSFDVTGVALAVAIVVGIFSAARHFRKLEFEELSLNPVPYEAPPAEPQAEDPKPVEKVNDWRQTLRLLKLPAHVSLEGRHDTVFLTKGGVERRLQPLAEFADELLSVRVCLDLSDSVRETVPEENIRAHVENLLADAGVGINEDSKISLAFAVCGVWDEKKAVFQHKEKIAVLETAVLMKEDVATAESHVLWGAEYSGRAGFPELENDLLGVARVFVELFVNDRLIVRTHEQAA